MKHGKAFEVLGFGWLHRRWIVTTGVLVVAGCFLSVSILPAQQTRDAPRRDEKNRARGNKVWPQGAHNVLLVPQVRGRPAGLIQRSPAYVEAAALPFEEVTGGEEVGACCFMDSSCQNLTEAACAEGKGTFYGPDRLCEFPDLFNPGACPGACCAFDSDKSCTDHLGRATCENFLQGFFQGDGTQCTDAGIACPTEVGACCFSPFFLGELPSENCLDAVTELECLLVFLGYSEFHKSQSCLDVQCPTTLCPGFGDCCAPHRALGCNDDHCCRMVCAADPWCCFLKDVTITEWNEVCVSLANRLCGDGTGGYCASRIADLNGDGIIDILDYQLFQLEFGRGR